MNKMTATRTLGTGDAALEVSAIGYGCMGLDSAWGTPMDPADAISLLRQAHELTVAAVGVGGDDLVAVGHHGELLPDLERRQVHGGSHDPEPY